MKWAGGMEDRRLHPGLTGVDTTQLHHSHAAMWEGDPEWPDLLIFL